MSDRWERAATEAVAHLARAAEIIETGDQRLMAADGPCGGLPPDISLDEWGEMYRAIRTAIDVLDVPVSPEATDAVAEALRFAVHECMTYSEGEQVGSLLVNRFGWDQHDVDALLAPPAALNLAAPTDTEAST